MELLREFHKLLPQYILERPSSRHRIWSEDAAETANGIRPRDYLRHYFSYAIPSEDALIAISKLSPIIEIGAGSGYWAELLRTKGATVEAYDNGSWQTAWKRSFGVVKNGGPEKVLEYPSHNLFLCWPPYDDKMAAEATINFLSGTGEFLIYIGEGDGGCTGDESFHELLRTKFSEVSRITIPQWSYIHDYLTIYKKK